MKTKIIAIVLGLGLLGMASVVLGQSLELKVSSSSSSLPLSTITSPQDSAKTIDTLRLVAVGDVMPGSIYPTPLLPQSCEGLFEQSDSLIASADLSFLNLEGVLTTDTSEAKPCNGPCYFFAMPPATAQCLKNVGFDLYSTANNHASDFGKHGRTSTVTTLDSLGLAHSGFEPCSLTVVHKNNLQIGFLAFSPSKYSCPMNDEGLVDKLVRTYAPRVDILIISVHAGAEGRKALVLPKGREFFYGQDRGDLRNFSHKVIDAGADIVLGHGPHVPRAMELYKDRLIAYSLGNFATWKRMNLSNENAFAPLLEITLMNDGAFKEGVIHSFKQTKEQGPHWDQHKGAFKTIRQRSLSDVNPQLLHFDTSGRFIPRLE